MPNYIYIYAYIYVGLAEPVAEICFLLFLFFSYFLELLERNSRLSYGSEGQCKGVPCVLAEASLGLIGT